MLVIIAERFLPEPGGLAVASHRIALHARARGEPVHVVCWSNDAPPGGCSVRERDGLVLHAIGRLPESDTALLALADHATNVVRSVNATLVHGIYALGAGYVATLVAAWTGLPSVVSLRGNDFDRALFRAAELPFLAHVLERATVVTAVSREITERARRAFAREVEYVPNSVDSALFKPETPDNSLRAALGLGDDPIIGFLGEMREKKGMRFLLPAFAEVARTRGARLLLIGGVRAEAQPALDVFARTAPDAMARLHLLEYSRSPRRISQLLALADLMVFPSLIEGLPNAVLEAMAAARPVLATEVGGHCDLIEHGVSGALLAPSELDQLPQAIEEILNLPEEARVRLGQAARARVATCFTPEQESGQYGAIYARARALGPSSATTPGHVTG